MSHDKLAAPGGRRSGYLPTLDGWRAIAIAMVFINHSPLQVPGPLGPRIASDGAMGVDLFFAISGILICSRLLDEDRLQGRISLGGFYLRRLFRILPAACLYLAATGILAAAHFLPLDWHSWWSALLFWRNYYTVFIAENFAGHATGHFWSLSVEEHFYLILPAVLVFFPRRRLLALSALTTASFAWLIFYVVTTPPMLRQVDWERRTDLRLQSLLLPALLALLLTIPRARKPLLRVVRVVVWVYVAVLAAGTVKHFTHHAPAPPVVVAAVQPGGEPVMPQREAHLDPIQVFVAPILLPLLVLATMLHPTSWISRGLEFGPLRAIGRVSYSLYLWQQLFWVSSDSSRWPIHRFQRPLYGFLITVAFAVASYFFVEKPMIRLGHRLAPPATPGRSDLDEPLPSALHTSVA